MNFEAVMQFTRKVSGATALQDDEARVLYDIATMIPPDGGHIVEIGCQYGRSTSLLAQVAGWRNLRLSCIDPFQESEGAGEEWFGMMMKLRACPFTLHCHSSRLAADVWPIDMLYIDGDHTFEGVDSDCTIYTPLVVDGGYVCFHDYQRASLPGVTEAVDKWMLPHDWEPVAHVNTMAAWRKRDKPSRIF